MIITCVKNGTYFVVSSEDFRVVAEITRKYKRAPYGKTRFWSDGYVLRNVDNGEETHYRTLRDIHFECEFENYPGYNSILKGQK
jgi:hypothetical protein